ncbi:uncharacterized protein LOC112179716 [Rosa chinensis]|uniref:uncharacterized protein LOC112179716 n=1 Tax=Rosa chinensis TaxID=74649 RepID=UPI001AD93EA6|nr:uncharacterized protein LOC112179716 [Rosa chinensis]
MLALSVMKTKHLCMSRDRMVHEAATANGRFRGAETVEDTKEEELLKMIMFSVGSSVSTNISTPTSALADYQEEKKRRRRRRKRRRGRREEVDARFEQKLSRLIIPGVLFVLQFGV